MGLDTATAVEGYMPVAQPGAPKCPPFASLCECNKNCYYATACTAATCARATAGIAPQAAFNSCMSQVLGFAYATVCLSGLQSVCLRFINNPCPKMGAAASGSHEVVA